MADSERHDENKSMALIRRDSWVPPPTPPSGGVLYPDGTMIYNAGLNSVPRNASTPVTLPYTRDYNFDSCSDDVIVVTEYQDSENGGSLHTRSPPSISQRSTGGTVTFCRRCSPESGASVRDRYDEPLPVPPLEESCISSREASSLVEDRIWFLDYFKPVVDESETSSSNSATRHANRSKPEQTSWGNLTPLTILQHVHNFKIPKVEDQSPGHKLRLVLIDPVVYLRENRRDASSPVTKLPLATEHISDLLEHFNLPFAYLASRNNRHGSDTFLRLVSPDGHSKTPWIAYAIRFPNATKSDLEPMTIVLSSKGTETYGVLEGLPVDRWKSIFSARRLRVDGGITPAFVLSLLISENTVQLLHAVQRLELAFREFETQSSARTIGSDLNPVIVFPKYKLQKRGTDMSEQRRRRYNQRPVFPKVRKVDVSPETLKYYDLEWEEDSDPDYLIIMKEMNDIEMDMIFEHSSRLAGPTKLPVYFKIRTEHVAVASLEYYDLPWEYDLQDSDYVIILRELSNLETDRLFEHTRRLRETERLKRNQTNSASNLWSRLRGRNKRPLKTEEMLRKEPTNQDYFGRYAEAELGRDRIEARENSLNNGHGRERLAEASLEIEDENRNMALINLGVRPMFRSDTYQSSNRAPLEQGIRRSSRVGASDLDISRSASEGALRSTALSRGDNFGALEGYLDKGLSTKRDASSITREKSRKDAAERNVSALRLSELRKQLTDLTYASSFNSRIASAILKPVLEDQALFQDDGSSFIHWGASSIDAMIVEQLENSLSHSSSMLERLSCLERRADGASALMFNSASHRENELNRQIAEVSRDIAAAAKRDSWQMKSIAIVTLLFLPPTAVSTFFSMGFFNWQNATKSDDVVNPYFWVYWAVAVPITILVILAWDIYTKWREDKEKIDGYTFSFERNVWVNSLTQEDVDVTPDADGLLFWQFNPLLFWPVRAFIFFVRYFRLWPLLPSITRFQSQSWDFLKKSRYRGGYHSESLDEDYLKRSRDIYGHKRRLGIKSWFRGRYYRRRARSRYPSRSPPRPRRSASSLSSPDRRTRTVEDSNSVVRRDEENRNSINDGIDRAVTNANVAREKTHNIDSENRLARIDSDRDRKRYRGRKRESDLSDIV